MRKPHIILIDEVGYEELTKEQANLFFQVVNARYEHGSMVLTTNKSFGRWAEVLNDEAIATATLDRLLHHAHVYSLKGDSYRMKDRMKIGVVDPVESQEKRNSETPFPELYHRCLHLHSFFVQLRRVALLNLVPGNDLRKLHPSIVRAKSPTEGQVKRLELRLLLVLPAVHRPSHLHGFPRLCRIFRAPEWPMIPFKVLCCIVLVVRQEALSSLLNHVTSHKMVIA